MRAMLLEKPHTPLTLCERPQPCPGPWQLLIKVTACGICRTDLHILDGELSAPRLPLIPGHQIVGRVVAKGEAVITFAIGQRVGVPWLGGSCGQCAFCANEQENLCDNALYTGYQIDGGLAEYTVADSRYCFLLPAGFSDFQAAPLLCAGLIGYRAYRRARQAEHLGLYGFGAAAHILIQIARHNSQQVYAFTRAGDLKTQAYAQQLGACWVGNSSQAPPVKLDASIIFAPAGELIPAALQALRKGGRVICAGIHMSDIPSFPYRLLWGERSIESIANLTRRDGEEFLPLAACIPLQTDVHCYPLEQANEALEDLRFGRFSGAAVMVP